MPLLFLVEAVFFLIDEIMAKKIRFSEPEHDCLPNVQPNASPVQHKPSRDSASKCRAMPCRAVFSIFLFTFSQLVQILYHILFI